MKLQENLIRLARFQLKEQHQRLNRLNQMIAEFNLMSTQLESQIITEEKKNGILNTNHFAYSPFAKVIRFRCKNLQASIEQLIKQREISLQLLVRAEEDLSKAEKLENNRFIASKNQTQNRTAL